MRVDDGFGLNGGPVDYEGFPRAVLLTGIPGVGKKTLSRQWAKGLLCRGEGPVKPCGQCRSCRRIEKGISHENLICLTLPRGRKSIGVKAVTENVIEAASRSSLEAGRRVVLIHDADLMTPQAQNALLKTLEDPPDDNTWFILTADRLYAILPTIISRCAVIHAPLWPAERILKVLLERGYPREDAERAAETAGGSLGAAIDLCGSRQALQAGQTVADTFFSVRSVSDIQEALTSLKGQKDLDRMEMKLLQERLALLIRLRTGGGTREAERLFGPEWAAAPVRSLERIFECVVDAARYRASNVSWMIEAENIMRIIMEERALWRS